MSHASPSLPAPLHVAAAMLVGLTIAAAGTSYAAGPARASAGGPPGPGGMVEHVLATMKDKLALDTSQQVQFDRISAQMVAVRDQAFKARTDVRARVEAELAKAEPDLATVASAFDSADEQGRAARRQIRDQWLAFYANLRADQKTIVRDAMRDRLTRMDSMHDRMPRRPS